MLPCQLISLSGLTRFDEAFALQQQLAAHRREGRIVDTLLLMEHPPTITLGRGSCEDDLLTDRAILARQGIEVVNVDRGGEITYHAPGQIVGYPILDLSRHGRDLHRYLRRLEDVLIRLLAGYGLPGRRIAGLTGVWVGDTKIAAIGIKVTRWITMHGFALNVSLDLTPMRRDIVPCGIADKGVTSLAEQDPQRAWRRDDVEQALTAIFADVFEMNMFAGSTGILFP